MDKALVFGTSHGGSIPSGRTILNHPPMKKIILVLIALALLGSAAYYIYDRATMKFKEDITPPALETSEGAALQGKLETSKDKFHKFEEDYIKKYQKPTGAKEESSLAPSPYVNYFYSTEDLSFGAVIENIVPVEGQEIFIAVYNPGENICISGEEGFYTYPKGPFTNATSIPKVYKSTIKAHCVFTISSTKSSTVWNLKNHTDPITEAKFTEIVQSRKNTKGWTLIPAPDSKNTSSLLKKASHDKALVAIGLDKEITKTVDDIKVAQFSGSDFMSKSPEDLEKLSINKGSYIMWVKFGDPKECKDGEYSAGETCHKCTAKSKTHECTAGDNKLEEFAIWNFNEKSGKEVLDSIGYNDGKIEGGKYIKGVAKGYALQFDGTEDQYAKIPHDPSLNATGTEMSMSAWAKPASYASGQVVKKGKFGIWNDENAGWRVNFGLNDKSFATDWNEPGMPSLDQWYHIVGTYDGEKITIYIDGEWKNSLSKDGTLNTNELPVFIGTGDGFKPFNGAIDEVVFYNKALSAKEVEALYKSYK